MEELNADNTPLNEDDVSLKKDTLSLNTDDLPLDEEDLPIEEDKLPLNADNLPLEVREHLMRGQHYGAVKVLKEKHGLKKKKAEKLIEDYRQYLRERKVALEIQIMHHQQEKETKEQYHLWWTWGMRIFLAVGCLTLLYLTAGSTF